MISPDLPLHLLVLAFAAGATAIAIAGVSLTEKADRLADITGIGEALAGAVLLGMATSLAGTVVSFTAAVDGRASLAFSNAVGGIAAQTAFLAVADISYRRANLEHASADPSNLYQAALLISLLSLPVAAIAGPAFEVFGMHPVSYVLPVAYVAGIRVGARVRDAPMWTPIRTSSTRTDRPEEDPDGGRALPGLIVRFAVLVAILAVAGWTVSKSGGALSSRLGISETAVGALLTAVATSLPELITTLAAVRRGALQLAVGGIIGGNSFDVLFLTAADAGYREGSIYHAIGGGDLFWISVGLVLAAILMLGLIVRQREGPGRIGVESVLILAVYVGAVAVQVAAA